MRVVAHAVGLHGIAFVVDYQHLRACVSEVHPQRARPRSAIEGNEERAVLRVVDAAPFVVGVVQGGDRAVVVAIDRLGADGDAIRHPLAANPDLGVFRLRRVDRQLPAGQVSLVALVRH